MEWLPLKPSHVDDDDIDDITAPPSSEDLGWKGSMLGSREEFDCDDDGAD